MNYPIFFEPKNSLQLFGLNKDFQFISSLYQKKKLPNVLMFSGKKGSGKSTLINHFFYSIFDNTNYNDDINKLDSNSNFHKQFKENIFSNVIYINGSEFKSVKVDEIRNLKKRIFQSTILNKDRFIVLDDIELFNLNSLNALLKIIEEPSKNNFFFLINNKSKYLLETIKSRALEIKIILNENCRLKIISDLINSFDLDLVIDPKNSGLTPGNFIKFNYVCDENNIKLTNNFVDNLSVMLNLYKKEKDILFLNMTFFLADYYFNDLKFNKKLNNNNIYEIKNYVFENLNNFMKYNLNQKTLLNAINTKLNYE